MRIAMCQKDIRGDFRESLEWMAASSFDGVQVWKRHMDDAGLTAPEVKTMADDLGLVITAVGGGPNLVDPATSAEVIDHFRRFLDLSVELGSGIVTAESKAKPAGLTDEAAWESTGATVSAICAHAAEVGAVLAIECAGPCFIADHDDWHELARRVRSGSLRVNFDPANIVWAGRDPVEAVQSLGAHIVHTHAKDIVFTSAQGNDGQPGVQDVPAGEGECDYPAYLAALAETGYRGFLTVEMHPGPGDGRARALQAAHNLRGMLETVTA